MPCPFSRIVVIGAVKTDTGKAWGRRASQGASLQVSRKLAHIVAG